jgi:predicted small secreted protein
MKRTVKNKKKYKKRKTLKGGQKIISINPIKPIEPLKQKYLSEATQVYQKPITQINTGKRISNHYLVKANQIIRNAIKATGQTNL